NCPHMVWSAGPGSAMATGSDTAEQVSAVRPEACAATGEHSSAPGTAAATATRDRLRIRRRDARNDEGVPGDMADHPFGVSQRLETFWPHLAGVNGERTIRSLLRATARRQRAAAQAEPEPPVLRADPRRLPGRRGGAERVDLYGAAGGGPGLQCRLGTDSV